MTNMAIRIAGAPASQFPAVPDGTGAILVTLGNQDPDIGELEYTLTTNFGYGYPPKALARVLGVALHQLAHGLLSQDGQLIDLADLRDPEAAARTGGED